jgi:antitoxin PrlF
MGNGDDGMKVASKLTTKYQATIPKEVREILGLGKGDVVVFEINDGRHVHITRGTPLDLQYLRSLEGTLGEWFSANDEEAYGEL